MPRLASRAKFERVLASFDAVPLPSGTADLTVFNASLHYAVDLPAVLAEARRLTRLGGTIAILDSPFYRREKDGEAMVCNGLVGVHRVRLIKPLTYMNLSGKVLIPYLRRPFWSPATLGPSPWSAAFRNQSAAAS